MKPANELQLETALNTYAGIVVRLVQPTNIASIASTPLVVKSGAVTRAVQ